MSTPRLFSSKLLAQVSKLIDQLSDEEAVAIADGSAWISLTIERNAPSVPRTVTAKPSRAKATKVTQPKMSVESLVRHIQQCGTREEVRTILDNSGKLTKDDLKSILAALDESTKDANTAKLQERIIEAVVGMQSDTKSIRGW